MGNSAEKVYDIMFKDNDKYVRIYGDASAQKLAKDSYSVRKYEAEKKPPKDKK